MNVPVFHPRHTRSARRLGPAGVLLLCLGVAAGVRSGEPVVIPQAQPAVDGNRAPYDLAFSPDGRRVYITELAEGTVAVVDADRQVVLERFSTGGDRPTGVAVTPDGSRLVVANSYSGTVAVLDVRARRQEALIPVPGMPYAVAVSPDGSRAYVSVSQLDEIAVLNLQSGLEAGRIPVGRRPRALALTPDGATLVAANMTGASLSVIDTSTLREAARVRLKGPNVRGVAVTADGTEAYVPVMPAFSGRPTADPREIWHNLVQGVTLRAERSIVGEDQWMDFARIPGSSVVVGTPDQHDILLDRTARFAWVSSAGRDVVTRITIHDPRRDAVWPISQIETVVGANPRGMALSSDGSRVWVANHLGNSLTVLDAASMRVTGVLELGPASRRDPTIAGQYLFNNARATEFHRFTCNSCHPDGGSDGLTWSFVHVKDGFGRRNSRDLRAGIRATAPFRWSGSEHQLTEFIESEITGLLRGPRPAREALQALTDAVAALRLPPNPYRDPGERLSALGQAGQKLFHGAAGCAGCHGGERQGGTGLKAWIGTTPENRLLDVPHLRGVYDSAPYLHDGRAATLEAIFDQHNPDGRHGAVHRLTPDERQALLRYLREL